MAKIINRCLEKYFVRLLFSASSFLFFCFTEENTLVWAPCLTFNRGHLSATFNHQKFKGHKEWCSKDVRLLAFPQLVVSSYARPFMLLHWRLLRVLKISKLTDTVYSPMPGASEHYMESGSWQYHCCYHCYIVTRKSLSSFKSERPQWVCVWVCACTATLPTPFWSLTMHLI